MYSLAQAADLTQTCLANWYGKRNYEPSVSALEKVCKAIEISMAQLFCDESENVVPVNEELKEIFVSWQKLTEAQKVAIMAHIRSYI